MKPQLCFSYKIFSSFNGDIYQVNTRSTQVNNIHVPATSTVYFSQSLSVYGSVLWNSIPTDIRNMNNIDCFKRSFKVYLLNTDDV